MLLVLAVFVLLLHMVDGGINDCPAVGDGPLRFASNRTYNFDNCSVPLQIPATLGNISNTVIIISGSCTQLSSPVAIDDATRNVTLVVSGVTFAASNMFGIAVKGPATGVHIIVSDCTVDWSSTNSWIALKGGCTMCTLQISHTIAKTSVGAAFVVVQSIAESALFVSNFYFVNTAGCSMNNQGFLAIRNSDRVNVTILASIIRGNCGGGYNNLAICVKSCKQVIVSVALSDVSLWQVSLFVTGANEAVVAAVVDSIMQMNRESVLYDSICNSCTLHVENCLLGSNQPAIWIYPLTTLSFELGVKDSVFLTSGTSAIDLTESTTSNIVVWLDNMTCSNTMTSCRFGWYSGKSVSNATLSIANCHGVSPPLSIAISELLTVQNLTVATERTWLSTIVITTAAALGSVQLKISSCQLRYIILLIPEAIASALPIQNVLSFDNVLLLDYAPVTLWYGSSNWTCSLTSISYNFSSPLVTYYGTNASVTQISVRHLTVSGFLDLKALIIVNCSHSALISLENVTFASKAVGGLLGICGSYSGDVTVVLHAVTSTNLSPNEMSPNVPLMGISSLTVISGKLFIGIAELHQSSIVGSESPMSVVHLSFVTVSAFVLSMTNCTIPRLESVVSAEGTSADTFNVTIQYSTFGKISAVGGTAIMVRVGQSSLRNCALFLSRVDCGVTAAVSIEDGSIVGPSSNASWVMNIVNRCSFVGTAIALFHGSASFSVSIGVQHSSLRVSTVVLLSSSLIQPLSSQPSVNCTLCLVTNSTFLHIADIVAGDRSVSASGNRFLMNASNTTWSCERNRSTTTLDWDAVDLSWFNECRLTFIGCTFTVSDSALADTTQGALELNFTIVGWKTPPAVLDIVLSSTDVEYNSSSFAVVVDFARGPLPSLAAVRQWRLVLACCKVADTASSYDAHWLLPRDPFKAITTALGVSVDGDRLCHGALSHSDAMSISNTKQTLSRSRTTRILFEMSASLSSAASATIKTVSESAILASVSAMSQSGCTSASSSASPTSTVFTTTVTFLISSSLQQLSITTTNKVPTLSSSVSESAILASVSAVGSTSASSSASPTSTVFTTTAELPKGAQDSIGGVVAQIAVNVVTLPLTLLSGVGVAMGAERAVLQMKLSACEFSLEDEVDIATNPTRLGIGSPQGRFVRGAVVGNLAIMLSVFALAALAAWLTSYVTQLSLVEAVGLLSLPGHLVAPFAWLLQPTVSMATALTLSQPAGAADLAVGLAALALLLVALCLIVVTTTLRFGAAAVREHSVAPDCRGGRLYTLVTWLCRREYEWVDADRHDGFVARYGLLFEAYRGQRQWFVNIELSVNIVVAVLVGAIPVGGGASCTSLLYGCVTVNASMFVVHVVLHPHMSKLESGAARLQYALSFVWSVLALVQSDAADQSATAVSQTQIFVAAAMLLMSLPLIAASRRLMRFVLTLRFGTVSARSGGVRKDRSPPLVDFCRDLALIDAAMLTSPQVLHRIIIIIIIVNGIRSERRCPT